jgi:hypothetical protein
MPSTRRDPVEGLRVYGGGLVTDHDIEIPPSGLINADLAALIAGVKVTTIRVWKNRGRLDIARDTDGRPFRDNQGRQLFNYMDVIEAEYETRERARRRMPYAA